MTLHQTMVLYTGALYALTGLTLMVAWKVLGPAYEDHLTIGWRLRAPIFVSGLMAVIEGMVIIFPGRLVHTEHMSPVRSLWVTSLFATVLSCTEFVAAHRAPPPVMQRLQRAFEIMSGSDDNELAQAGMALPTAAIGEPPPLDLPVTRAPSLRLRRLVLSAAVVALVGVFALILHAAAATLPH